MPEQQCDLIEMSLKCSMMTLSNVHKFRVVAFTSLTESLRAGLTQPMEGESVSTPQVEELMCENAAFQTE